MGMIGNNRSEAVWQLVGLVYLLTVYPVVLTIGLIGGLIYMLGDVLAKLVMDKPAGSSSLKSWSMRLFQWPINQLQWIATGDGEFPFLP